MAHTGALAPISGSLVLLAFALEKLQKDRLLLSVVLLLVCATVCWSTITAATWAQDRDACKGASSRSRTFWATGHGAAYVGALGGVVLVVAGWLSVALYAKLTRAPNNRDVEMKRPSPE